MFLIGPWEGVRLLYDCSVFAFEAPWRSTNNSMVMEQIKDADGKVIRTERHKPHVYYVKRDPKTKQFPVQGYPLRSYLPKTVAQENFIL